VQFLSPDDFRAHEARVCIAEGHVLADTRRPRRFTAQQYLTTQAEMAAKFADLPEALANSVAIAQRCNLTIALGENHLPEFPTPAGVTLDEHLRREAAAGLERRLAQLYPDVAERESRRAEYATRLEFETKTIVQMGFAGYFLIVADFINWAKSNHVPVGPGRGSGAGSLVAYALGITDLDPLRYQLLFERFLNPDRVSMPDFDIDFCQDTREKVIEYVKQKYGSDSVSQIATFGTMAAKAAVRDVGRVLDLPYTFCDGIAKLIPFQPGKLVTLAQARKEEPLLAEREQKEEEVRELLALAESLEGLTRNVGMHAGGVLIAPGKLTDFCPLYVQPGADAMMSQFDKDDVEAIGLVKFDFLGLTTLTILDWTLRYIRKLDPTGRSSARHAAPRRSACVRHLPYGEYERRVPVRIARHARPAAARAADAFRGHHCAGGAVSPGTDGADPRLRRAQAGPAARRVSGQAARADPRPDIRRHGVPGTGDADRADDRRLHAGRRRPAASRDGQEKAGGNGQASRRFRRRCRAEQRAEEPRHATVRPDGEVCRLRIQQVARGGLRADRIPDCVLQGAPPGCVHGRQPVAGDG
jgi:DNA polymerase-3 subunit alpha